MIPHRRQPESRTKDVTTSTYGRVVDLLLQFLVENTYDRETRRKKYARYVYTTLDENTKHSRQLYLYDTWHTETCLQNPWQLHLLALRAKFRSRIYFEVNILL